MRSRMRGRNWGRRSRPLLPVPAAAPPARRFGRWVSSGSATGPTVITEKPFGIDLASARELNSCLLSVFEEEEIFRIDHYLGPGVRAEPAGAALRQRDVRAGLEPQPHRPCADRRSRDALDRDAGELLRGNGGFSRHDRDAPVPGAQLRRDGATDLDGGEGADDRAGEGLRLDGASATPPGWSAVSTSGYRDGGGSGARTPTPRPSLPCGPSSTTGAGTASPSICAPASAWPRTATC